MSAIIFKDVSLTKWAPAWKFFHSNEENKLAQRQQTKYTLDSANKDLRLFQRTSGDFKSELIDF